MDDCVRNAQQLAILANVIAVALTENLTVDEQNVLGNLIAQIGATILSIAAAAQFCNSAKSDNDQNSSDNTSQKNTDEITQKMKPDFIPQGYQLQSTVDKKQIFQLTYTNDRNEELIYKQVPMNQNDSDDQTHEVLIKGKKSLFYQKGNQNYLYWNDDTYDFFLCGVLPKDVLTEMANSVS